MRKRSDPHREARIKAMDLLDLHCSSCMCRKFGSDSEECKSCSTGVELRELGNILNSVSLNAQGFPPEYIIDVDADGKKYPKSAQVARCGNSVPPPFAEALVKANLPELCSKQRPYKAQHQLEMQLM